MAATKSKKLKHLYTPHKVHITGRVKELAQAGRRLHKQYLEEVRFMEQVDLLDVFHGEVKRCVEDTLAACKRLEEYINSVPDDPETGEYLK